MRRLRLRERADWRRQAEAVGFEFLTDDGKPYWDETACYRFSLAEIEEHIEAPTQTLLALCYQAVEHIVGRDDLLRRFGIPEPAWDYVRRSWRRQDKYLYGRFDFQYDGSGPVKLFEFNADTPTALFEAAVFQWQWLEQAIDAEIVPGGADQFNSIHERLIDALGRFGIADRTLHVACVRNHAEDRWTVEYLEDCAQQAGLATRFVHIEDIGVTADGRLTDLDDQALTDVFKLYPWEWLLADQFGAHVLKDQVRWIEPPWKLTLSNKGLLAVLWEMFPDHPSLLPTYFEDDPRAASLGSACVRKPLLGREGVGIGVGRQPPPRPGPYGAEGFVVQALCPPPELDGNRPVIGSWVVAGQACGIGIREDASAITGNTARFLPHIILDDG
ncbi:MAG: glutathionylspermidine synthase family protein [Proteobacteria bacterium]|nr:glutathionylspermidine synthase family protein [Pseudomonadota bacterium]